MKILVTGAGGMLGNEIVNTYGDYGIEVVGFTHQELDICDEEAINKAMQEHTPDIVINCAGIVKGRDLPDETYYEVNSKGPLKLAECCKQVNNKMIQISTDCVFSGEKGSPYYEYDHLDAEDIYGKSKALGEIANNQDLTLRMSFIGMGERGLVSWFLQQQDAVEGYMNVQWNGMTVHYAAKNILIAILKNMSGIVHVCGHDTTKYEVLNCLNNELRLDMRIIPAGYPVEDRRLKSIYHHNFDMPPIKKQIKEMVGAYYCDPCRP